MDELSDGNQEPVQPAEDAPEDKAPQELPESQPAESLPVSESAEDSGDSLTELQPEPTAGTPADKPLPVSRDDAMADMRRALREEEAVEETGIRAGFRRLMQRVFHRRKAREEEITEAPSRLDELQFPEPTPPPAATQPEPPKPPVKATTEPRTGPRPATGPLESKSDFGQAVRARLTDAFSEKEAQQPVVTFVPPVPPTPAPPPLVQEDVQPVESSRSILTSLRQENEEEQEEPANDTANIREAALEDYVSEPEEPEPERGTPVVRNLRRSWRYMRPFERRLLIGALAIVGLAALAGSGFLVISSIPTPTPVVTPTTSTLPFPISVSLPGGWIFPLRTGFVQNGKWDPKGPEWLSGTEVCRWVSLPSTVQLEAVLRTMKADDAIQLSMSNYDSIIYKVQSIEQVPSSEIAKLATDSPCLLLILSKQDSDSRWVVTAKP